jgi:hypothetical protein
VGRLLAHAPRQAQGALLAPATRLPASCKLQAASCHGPNVHCSRGGTCSSRGASSTRRPPGRRPGRAPARPRGSSSTPPTPEGLADALVAHADAKEREVWPQLLHHLQRDPRVHRPACSGQGGGGWEGVRGRPQGASSVGPRPAVSSRQGQEPQNRAAPWAQLQRAAAAAARPGRPGARPPAAGARCSPHQGPARRGCP